jgi:broad specificity phosphatase PhoE
MREASLYLLRHPATPYNMGAHGQERSRGHLRIPPDPEKTEEFVRRSAEPLRRAGVVEIETSTLPRAEFAAEALGRELGVPVIPQRALVTGDTGEMAGRL